MLLVVVVVEGELWFGVAYFCFALAIFVNLPILQGIKAIISGLCCLSNFIIFYGFIMRIVEVVKTRGNFQLKGECYKNVLFDLSVVCVFLGQSSPCLWSQKPRAGESETWRPYT